MSPGICRGLPTLFSRGGSIYAGEEALVAAVASFHFTSRGDNMGVWCRFFSDGSSFVGSTMASSRGYLRVYSFLGRNGTLRALLQDGEGFPLDLNIITQVSRLCILS